MGARSSINAMQAAYRRQEREVQKRFRELERQAKEKAKLSAIEQARLEVETYENVLEVLLSVHKEQGEVWDWMGIATALPPHSPRKYSRFELRAKQEAELWKGTAFIQQSETVVNKARLQDEQEFQEALKIYTEEKAEWEKMKALAQRILAGDHKAYTEALSEFSGLSEISSLGSSISFTVHHAKLIEAFLKVSGRQVIPTESKTITSTGKLSVKPMPKARFHEIYQDYVCGCILRVAREVFALLPVDTVIITASVETLDSSTGQTIERPVLSAAIPRAAVVKFNFDQLDPSDAIDSLLHRGDFKTSRKSGEFEPIAPLTPDDLPQTDLHDVDIHELFTKLQNLQNEPKEETEKANLFSTANAPSL